MMNRGTKIILWVGFIAYGLALFSALTFYRLPADRVLSRLADRMTHGKILLSTGKTSSSLWKGHHLEDLKWTIQAGGSVVTEHMESLIFSPDLLGLLKGYVPVKVKGTLGGGSFQGSAGASMVRWLNRGYANFEAKEIGLEDLAVLKLIAHRAIHGKMKGKVELHGALTDLKGISGQGTMVITDGAVDVRADGYGIDSLPFARLNLPFSVEKGVADLKGGDIVGPLFRGDLEGQIGLHQDLGASLLQVTARIRPAKTSQGKEAKGYQALGDSSVVLRLHGTVAKPVISWTGAFQ